MTARLRPLTSADVEQVRLWRDDPETRRGLRGPEPLTAERQQAWFRDVVCKPEASRHRFFAVEIEEVVVGRYVFDGPTNTTLGSAGHYEKTTQTKFVAQVGLENIAPRLHAEIHLITDPAVRGKGIGRVALALLLERGFNEYGLDRVWGSVYLSNPALAYWRKMLTEFHGFEMQDDDWTETNCADGREWPSRRFWFTADEWRKATAEVKG
jgi:RimJ/RimL family protein N-acetyltransferase